NPKRGARANSSVTPAVRRAPRLAAMAPNATPRSKAAIMAPVNTGITMRQSVEKAILRMPREMPSRCFVLTLTLRFVELTDDRKRCVTHHRQFGGGARCGLMRVSGLVALLCGEFAT